ncbi:MAG: type VI secretion system tip protein VgrG, partial [Myxococcales bacterium]|nr:type VI secretion system tip protein VgrG [Myxococcales bacterium]
ESEIVLELGSLLELWKLKVTSRIFTDKTTPEILAIIAGEWKMEHEHRLSRAYDRRAYTTQFRESDLEFITRITARDGIGFFLEHPTAARGDEAELGQDTLEKLVFYDHAGGYASLPDGGDSRQGGTLFHRPQRTTATEHDVTDFRLTHRVRPELVRLGDFDFRKPALKLRARAAIDAKARSPIGASLGGQLSVYTHNDRAELEPAGKPGAEIGDGVARVRLEQARRDAEVGRGRSRCPRLAPGITFTLEDHPGGAATNRSWLVTRVEHTGKIPERGGAETDAPIETYSNEFHCVPAELVHRHALVPARAQHAVETATVIGPKGAELSTDQHGRVQVEFHWELDGDGDSAAKRTWLRVSQLWSGTNWGAQFLPRIGTEVIVGFLGGDTDRPVVLGSVYNGTHPYPFRLPLEAHKSGIRSQSTPGGEGYSELIFDDEKGKEKLSIRAEKDLVQLVENDYELVVGNAENVRVDGSSARTIAVDATETVLGDKNDTVGLDYQLAIKGSHVLSVSGNSDLRVAGARVTRIEGQDNAEHFLETDHIYRSDRTERVLGHLVTIVGANDARRSATLHVEGSVSQYSTGTAEIVSDKALVLRSGKSEVRIGPEGVEINTPKLTFKSDSLTIQGKDEITLFSSKQVAIVSEKLDVVTKKTVVLKSEGAQLRLDRNARIDGEQVKLNCSPEPVDEKKEPDYEPPKPTIIKLADEDGKPLAHRRFVVVLADGSERGGMLDGDGKAELFLDESAEVVFPDVDQARKG